ncbi:DUF3883 domain-containing protein [Polaribacter porphyrae]|uniref:Protein NO VEIN C-terminal domain-containing protein n=1 Tax=Polaribacter porphyrae TaxID=1137780 RepID=A0A2S7WPN6_9FLAO|nr:DUF3883 domain-containing protein [Polaribacter porphyrae]PQJ79559.1 hypothetical protein BTO18_10415 [Polaribacter porphyrae]
MIKKIKKKHIIDATKYIDYIGIPKDNIYNYYWIKLDNGKEYPFKLTVREAYKLTTNTDEYYDFSSNKETRKTIEDLGFEIKYYTEHINFLKDYEVEKFSDVAGSKYRKANPENVRYGMLIAPTAYKINYWAENSTIENFVIKSDKSWQWSGSFKSYLWIRIFRKNDSKKVYFVLGVDDKGNLYLELNCQRSNHTGGKTQPLTKERINEFDKYLNSSTYIKKIIKKEHLKNYNWHSLISLTKDFLHSNSTIYDELEIISKEKFIELNQDNDSILTVSDIPESTKSYVNKERNFKGKKIDWSKKQLVSSRLGLLGEELIIEYEKSKIKKLKKENILNDNIIVEKKRDGEGYDILSYDKNGNKLFIEVKTTKGKINEPFYLSINEKAFYEKHKSQYIIYRLYEFNNLSKTSKLYKIEGSELDDFNFNPTNFEISKGDFS